VFVEILLYQKGDRSCLRKSSALACKKISYKKSDRGSVELRREIVGREQEVKGDRPLYPKKAIALDRESRSLFSAKTFPTKRAIAPRFS
jgi:hypothetical protein